MSKRHFVAGAFTGAGALFFIGAAAAVAPAPEVQTTQAPPTQAPAPATVIKTETVTRTTPLPSVCTDYIRQVDTAMQGVIDYDSSIAGVKAAEQAGSLAMADHDQAALSEARTKLNHILNESVGPLQDLFAAQPVLSQARDACDKALGG